MKISPCRIPEVLLIEPYVFLDARGVFFEAFNRRDFKRDTGLDLEFVQTNRSKSERSVLRGLHYQQAPHEQGKLVHVTAGEIFDVAVDIRPESKTYGQWVGNILSAKNNHAVWMPSGFAHGFLALTDADVAYSTTDYYDYLCERCIVWNDPEIGIDWNLATKPKLSLKDSQGLPFKALTKREAVV